MNGRNDSTPHQNGIGTSVISGPGALCAEAQADGVPCTELGKICEECERAAATRKGREEG